MEPSWLLAVGVGLALVLVLAIVLRLRERRGVREHAKALAHARASATTAREAFDQLAYAISHDLRAPVRHVIGFTDLVLERHARALDPKTSQQLAQVGESARQMDAYLQTLLRYARSGAPPSVTAPVDLVGLLREHARATEMLLPERAPLVLGDPARLRELVGHLLTALDAHEAPGALMLEAHASGDQVTVRARDRARAFKPGEAERAFDVRFEPAADASPSDAHALPLARRIAHAHGGAMWCESEPGARVIAFCLPAAATSASGSSPR